MMRMIVAVDSAGGMATGDGIPWTLPTDQRFFSDQIAIGLILMGYTTYDEISEPLHGRTNYVATRRSVALREGFTAVPDAATFIAEHHGEMIQNIGGAGLFASTLHLADELVMTRIAADFRCTKFFPPFRDRFDLIAESDRIVENDVTFTFQTWRPHHES
jgi:dihydrofolate reductase